MHAVSRPFLDVRCPSRYWQATYLTGQGLWLKMGADYTDNVQEGINTEQNAVGLISALLLTINAAYIMGVTSDLFVTSHGWPGEGTPNLMNPCCVPRPSPCSVRPLPSATQASMAMGTRLGPRPPRTWWHSTSRSQARSSDLCSPCSLP